MICIVGVVCEFVTIVVVGEVTALLIGVPNVTVFAMVDVSRDAAVGVVIGIFEDVLVATVVVVGDVVVGGDVVGVVGDVVVGGGDVVVVGGDVDGVVVGCIVDEH